MPKSAKDEGPPLYCILCPNSKRFSDLSHLLTHLNSKGHLQCKHKLELRGGDDYNAKDTLEKFGQWYNDNNFAQLLSDRMQPKDKKKYAKVEKVTKSKSKKASVKIKPESDTEDEPAPAQFANFRAPEPQMNPLFKRSQSYNDAWEASVYITPSSARVLPHFTPSDAFGKTPVDPSLSDGSWKDMIPSEDSAAKDKNTTLTLKGEVFDGMDVFDSATPRTKRRRNQRKGPQVVQQMMKSSAEVEPAEVSFHASGEFRGSRNIYDPLSEDDNPHVTPSPQKKRKVTRSALANKSANRLMSVPNLRPPMAKRSASMISPSKRPAIFEEADYNPTTFRFASDYGSSHMQKTINPFKLFLQPDNQVLNHADSCYAQHSVNNPLSKKVRFYQHHEHVVQQKTRPVDNSHVEMYQDQGRIKMEEWNNPLLNPLASYQEPTDVISDDHYHMHSHALHSFAAYIPEPAISAPDNTDEDNAVNTKPQASRKKGPRAEDLPRGPRAGFFKTTTSWSTMPSQTLRSTATTSKTPVRRSGKPDNVKELDRTLSDDSEDYSGPLAYGSGCSPNITDRTSQSQQTPAPMNMQLNMLDGKSRKTQADDDHIEQEILATPRYNLRQAPSSSLRSTARSPHSSARRAATARQLHYGSDLDSQLFDFHSGDHF